MEEVPFLDPDDPDDDDDEVEADINPISVCRYCGAEGCLGGCEMVMGLNTP